MSSSKENADNIKALLRDLARKGGGNDVVLARLILKVVAKRPVVGRNKLIDSLIVRLSNQHDMTMHGRHVQDILGVTGARENKNFNVHPYRMAKSAATSAVIWRDKKGRPYILLGHKKPSMTDPATGTQYILPGGYMDPAALQGGDLGRKFDAGPQETMLRELQEETGLVPPKTADIQLIEHHSTHGETDHINAHSIVSAWLVDLGQNGAQPPRAVAGDDLAVVTWVRADRITRTKGVGRGRFGATKTHWRAQVGDKWLPIREMDGQAAEDGMRIIRDQELAVHGFSKETLLAAVKAVEIFKIHKKGRAQKKKLQKYLGAVPASEFGKKAEEWHRRSLKLAALLRAEMTRELTGIKSPENVDLQQIAPSDPASIIMPENGGEESHYKGGTPLEKLKRGRETGKVKLLLQLLTDRNKVTDKALLGVISKVVEKRGAAQKPLIESLLVALGNQRVKGIHGREFHDILRDEGAKGRKSYNLLPYRDPGGNAVGVPLYRDKSGEIFVLLGRKKPVPIAKGYDQILVFSGGYMDRAPLKGGKSLKGLTYDKSLEETLAREMMEETGIDIGDAKKVIQNGLRGLHNEKGNERAHNIVADYVIDFGVCDEPPAHAAADDLAALNWVKLSDIRKLPEGQELKVPNFASNYGVKLDGKEYPLRKFHCQMLEDGVRKLRQNSLAEKGLTYEGAEDFARALEKAEGKAKYSLMPRRVTGTEIGAAAENYHKAALVMAVKMHDMLREKSDKMSVAIDVKLQADKKKPKHKAKTSVKIMPNMGGGPR